MAAIFKVKLEDNYTDKAKKITSATSQMESAMSKVGSVAKKTGSALKSSLDRKYKVDIKETGSKYLENRVNGLKKSLDRLEKPYEVSITAKMSRLDKLKSNLSDLNKNTIGKSFGAVKKFKMDFSDFRRAKKEAKQLSKEISAFTGKKHKVKIDMESPIKGVMSQMKSGLSAGFSKLNPRNWFGGGGGGPTSSAPGGGGGLVGSIVKGSLITGAITKGIGVMKSSVDATIGAGMTRLENIQSAKARLRGQTNADGSRKFDDAAIKNISNSAMQAVQGTAYGFGDAMSVASSAIAAGVSQKNVGSYLKDIANISAATGSDFNEIGAIMNKIQTTGKLQGDELMQLSDKGLPILSKIAEIKGVDDKTAREMISKGAISSEDAFKAASMAAGNSATEMGQTREAAKMNFQAALSKLGAGLLGGSGGENDGIFGATTSALLKVNDVLNGMVPTFQKFGDKLGGLATGAIDKVKSGFDYLGNKFKPVGDAFAKVGGPLKDAMGSLGGSIGKIFGSNMDLGGSIIDTVLSGAVAGLTTLANIIQTYAVPAIQTAADFISANVVPVIQSVNDWIAANILPAIQSLGSYLMANVLPILQSIGSFITGGLMPSLQLLGAAAMSVLGPAFNALGQFAQGVLLPALSWLGETIMGSVVPALSSLVSWVIGSLLPVIVQIGSLIGSVVIPVVSAVASLIAGVVMSAFTILVGVVNTVVGIFNGLVSAVNAAIDALSGIGSAISSAVSGAVGKVKGLFSRGNATGTSYFGGGMTRVNERGEEMIQLARGDKIYPAGKTDRIIEKQINNKNQTRETKNITLSPTININGANKDGQEIAKEVNRQLKRLAVNI